MGNGLYWPQISACVCVTASNMSSWNQIIPVLCGLALEEFISGHALVGDEKMD